jgi:hypothetical protein
MRRKKLLFIVPAAIAGIVLFTFIGGTIVRLLWNWLTPALFGWPQITFWQALALLALCRILFGGLGRHGGYGYGRRQRMRERWAKMTPEEQQRFRDGMQGRCG